MPTRPWLDSDREVMPVAHAASTELWGFHPIALVATAGAPVHSRHIRTIKTQFSGLLPALILACSQPSEAALRIGTIILVVWLIIGAIAGAQRHYYSNSGVTCAKAGTVVVTILAGPLNYIGVNPKVTCPKPSK
jgi:hypothetical protein